MKKALLLTSFDPGIHAFTSDVERAFREALCDFDKIEVRESRVLCDMGRGDLAQYAVVVLYSAPIGRLGMKEDIAALFVDYLANGGGLMVVHYACTGEIDELAQVVGARFRMHPAYNRYHIAPDEHEHYALCGVQSFEIEDEMHLVFIDPFLPRHVLLRCLNDEGGPRGVAYPSTLDLYAKNSGAWVDSAWCHEYLRGRVVYTVPGHDAQSLSQPDYKRFLGRCARWLMKQDIPPRRQTCLLRVKPGKGEAFDACVSDVPPGVLAAFHHMGAKNASVWRVGDLAFGYCEMPGGPFALPPGDRTALDAWNEAIMEVADYIARPGRMRCMYESLGLVRRDKSGIRHRVFATRLKPGCAEEYRARHAALEDCALPNRAGKESNFTIWHAGDYIFGYCEMVVDKERAPKWAERAATIAWETRQLEIMDWLTDDVDWITGQSHEKARRVF